MRNPKRKTVSFLAVAAIIFGGSLGLASNAFAIDFVAAPGSPLSGLGPDGRGAVAGDFGGDAADDVVSISRAADDAASGGGIFMLINDGQGTLTETAKSACDPGADSPCENNWLLAGVYKADFDQDGHDDVLAIREGLDRYTIWRGDGNGHLEYGGSLNPARPLPSVNSLAIGDINQDDYPDVVVGYNGGDFGVHPNMGLAGPGMFSSAAPPVQSIVGAGVNDGDYFGSVAIGDYNGGGVDIAFGQVACATVGPGCASPYPLSNAVFVADGDGSPVNFIGATGNPHPAGTGRVITDIATLPMAVNGYIGLAVASTSAGGDRVDTYLGNTNLTLVPNPSSEGSFATGSSPRALTSEKLDTDSLTDLAWIEGGGRVGVAVQRDDGAMAVEAKGPFGQLADGPEYDSLSVGAFAANGAAGFALGGVTSADDSGSVGILIPSADFRVSDLDFGSVPTGTSKTLPISFSNQSVFSEYIIGSEIVGGSGEFELSGDEHCRELVINQGEGCTLNVTFSPQSFGNKAAELVINRDGPEARIALTGTAPDPVGPIPEPDPEPQPSTKVSVKLAPIGKIKAGKKLRVKATVKNIGSQTVRSLALRPSAPKRRVKRAGMVVIKSISPGATVRRMLVLKLKPGIKQGKKLQIKLVASSAGETLAMVRQMVRIGK